MESKGNHATSSGGTTTLPSSQAASSGGTTPPNPSEEHAEIVYLDKLAEELTHRGLEAWLMTPPGRVPSVYVVNPVARALEDNVYAVRGTDGLWWFWWSWAERIAVADDVDQAASTIQRVLASLRRTD